jgi:hypothetical protein
MRGRLSLAQLKSVHVQYNVLDGANTCVREFLNRVQAPKTAETNPKCEVSLKLRIDSQPPVVAVEFVNGVKEVINCKELTCQDIIKRLQHKTMEMDTQAMLKSAGLAGVKLEARFPDV